MVGFDVVTLAQTMGPQAILDIPWIFRGLAAFVIILAIGAAIRWRYDGVLDRSIEASIDRPVAAIGYGFAAHAAIAFAGVYLASQLGQFALSGTSLGYVGLWIGVGILAVIAGLGFTVVGTAIAELGGEPSGQPGLLIGAGIAGVAALSDPLIGGVIWLVTVSVGIGGPVRQWLHASADLDV